MTPKCVKGMTKDTCPHNPRLGCDCGANPPITKLLTLVTDGGMTSLKELPGQEDKGLEDKYFDQHTTYSPFIWKGSRRLTPEEMIKLLKDAI